MTKATRVGTLALLLVCLAAIVSFGHAWNLCGAPNCKGFGYAEWSRKGCHGTRLDRMVDPESRNDRCSTVGSPVGVIHRPVSIDDAAAVSTWFKNGTCASAPMEILSNMLGVCQDLEGAASGSRAFLFYYGNMTLPDASRFTVAPGPVIMSETPNSECADVDECGDAPFWTTEYADPRCRLATGSFPFRAKEISPLVCYQVRDPARPEAPLHNVRYSVEDGYLTRTRYMGGCDDATSAVQTLKRKLNACWSTTSGVWHKLKVDYSKFPVVYNTTAPSSNNTTSPTNSTGGCAPFISAPENAPASNYTPSTNGTNPTPGYYPNPGNGSCNGTAPSVNGTCNGTIPFPPSTNGTIPTPGYYPTPGNGSCNGTAPGVNGTCNGTIPFPPSTNGTIPGPCPSTNGTIPAPAPGNGTGNGTNPTPGYYPTPGNGSCNGTAPGVNGTCNGTIPFPPSTNGTIPIPAPGNGTGNGTNPTPGYYSTPINGSCNGTAPGLNGTCNGTAPYPPSTNGTVPIPASGNGTNPAPGSSPIPGNGSCNGTAPGVNGTSCNGTIPGGPSSTPQSAPVPAPVNGTTNGTAPSTNSAPSSATPEVLLWEDFDRALNEVLFHSAAAPSATVLLWTLALALAFAFVI